MPESSLTYTDLLAVDFGTLKSTVEDWNSVQKALTRLSAQAKDDLKAKSEAADWAGLNADKVRPFVREIADEVGDLHTEARSIWNVLDDAHSELVRIQGQIGEEREKAKRHQIRIHDKRDGTVACSFEPYTDNVTTPSGYYVGGSADEDDPVKSRTKADRELRDDIEATLNRLIGTARDIDASTTWALAKSHGNDRHNAGHATYTSLNDAQIKQATGLAEKQLRLSRDGKELTTEDLTRLAQLTRHNAKDAEFTTGFYRDLGPKRALMVHAQLGVDASTDGNSTRLDLSSTIQDSMSKGLALATQPGGGSAGDRTHLGGAWISDLKASGRGTMVLSGPQRLYGGAGANLTIHGYQALGNMLRHGKYDKGILTDVGSDMVAFERKNHTSIWRNPEDMSDAMHGANLNLGANRAKQESGFDPIAGLMNGLANNPDAATDFFRGSSGGDGSGVKEMKNIDYFLGDEGGKGAREWPPDGLDDSRERGKGDLGSALEAATTGRPAGDEGKPLAHKPEQAAVFEDAVRRLGSVETQSQLQHGGDLAPLRSHMGNMAADYMHDVQRAITSTPPGIIPEHGADPSLGAQEKGALERFLRNAAGDPDGYASILHSSHAVSGEAIRDAMDQRPGDHSLSEAASMGAKPGAEVAAMAAEGRADGVDASQDKVGQAERYNESLDAKQAMVGQIVDLGVGRVPFGGEIAGEVTGNIQDAVFGSYRRDPEEVAQKVEESRRDFLAGERYAEAEALRKIVMAAGRDTKEEGDSLEWAARNVARDAEEGFPNK